MSDSSGNMHDSGERRKFQTGAVRDMARDKSRPDLISPFATDRLGRWLALGAQKYDERNWEKGLPIAQCIASLERHLVAYKAGQVEEDHLAAVMCNAMFIAHYEHEIEAGRLPASLDDLPRYELQFDALLKVEKPQAGFSMTAAHCVQTPGLDAASQQVAQAEQLAAKVNEGTRVLDAQTYSGWTDEQLDKLVDVLYDIFGVPEHMAVTPAIAAQVAEAVDEINWQMGHVDEPKPVWTQYTGECTPDLKRLQDTWHKMEFKAPLSLSHDKLVAAAGLFWGHTFTEVCTAAAEKARLRRRNEMLNAIAEVTAESFRNLGVDRAGPDTDYSILALFTPKMWASHELDDILDKANALDDNPDTPWMDKKCMYMTDGEIWALHKETGEYLISLPDEERIAAAEDGDAIPFEDPGFSIVRPDHPKTHGISYWIRPETIIKARRPRAYLAGPMRGYKMFNFPAFKLATKLWTIRGYDITSPADMDEDLDHIDPIHDPAVAEGSTSEGLKGMTRKMAERDIETIRNLDPEKGDALIVLPGWRKSVGATAEVSLARWLGLTCYDALDGRIVEDK